MCAPSSTITVSGWMLQSVNRSTQKQRAQALTSKGNEHAYAYHSAQTAESASFTLGGDYTGNITLPALGEGITDYTMTYSETEFPKLEVTKSSAAGGGSFAAPFTLPARSIGCPSALPGIATKIGPCKQIAIAVSCQHVEETDGSGAYNPAKYSGMRDATVTVTFTGVAGKPEITPAEGWTTPSETDSDSNTAIAAGSVVYEKHFPVGTDAEAANSAASEP